MNIVFLITGDRTTKHVAIGVDQLMDQSLLGDPGRADKDKGFPAEGRHFFHGLVEQ